MSTDLQDYCSTCEFVFDVKYIVLNNILEYVMCIVFGIREKKAMPGILSSTVYEAMQLLLTFWEWIRREHTPGVVLLGPEGCTSSKLPARLDFKKGVSQEN